jgi:hypothetical protein
MPAEVSDMFAEPKINKQDAAIDQLCGELFRAASASEDEIAATASSRYGYDRVRLRIAEMGARISRRRSAKWGLRHFVKALLMAPRFVVLSGAAAILVLLAAALFVLLPGAPSTEPAPPSNEAIVPSNPSERKSEVKIVEAKINPVSVQSRTGAWRRQRSESRSTEIATDFLPLTFVDDSAAPQSGHLVRMKVPRSSLVAFGVPMNMDRAGELITADVIIGDDGLARAIRFIQ